MIARSDGDLASLADDVLAVADELAGRLAQTARARTSLACQRAMLRAVGVTGLAPNGRPLAMEVVQRFAGGAGRRLQSGVALPFALAAHEYDLDPQDLALEVAAGHVDLAAEAELLRGRSRSEPARVLLGAWLAAADERFEANRVARAELGSLLGSPPTPRVAVEVRSFDAREASAEAAALVAAGADLVRVRVPRDGELRDDLGAVAAEDDWPVGIEAPPPAGSQRGLALLRTALDEAGARNGRYARLATRRVGLAAPELAVVAGFERVDAIFTDPMDAIAEFGVDPDRALVDHAATHALLRRTGARLVLGPGPRVPVDRRPPSDGVDPARPDAAIESGWALALQALSRAFALRTGIAEDQLELGALPAFAVARDPGIRPLVEVALRALLFPGQRLLVDDHVAAACGPALSSRLTSWCAGGAPIATVVVGEGADRLARTRDQLRAATAAAGALATAREVGPLRGAAFELAQAILGAARDLLVRIDRSSLAEAIGRSEWLGTGGIEPLGSGDPASAWAWSDVERVAG